MTKKRVLLCYKNFAAWAGISHIGLGVSAVTNAEYLNANGIQAEVLAIKNNVDLVDFLKVNRDVTDVVISAPWLSLVDVEAMTKYFKDMRFIIVTHSNVGFLQADPYAFTLIRNYIALSREIPNLRIGANCYKFQEWLSKAYDVDAVALPNLYPVGERCFKPRHIPSLIRIGTFGAIRPQKNVLSAAAAALYIGKELSTPVEFSVSTGREDGGGNVILNAIRQMSKGLPEFFLVERYWSDWRTFRRIVREQDLLIQVSYTESFNMVTADGVAEGVPSVVSYAIPWAPDSWKVHVDDVVDIANAGIKLLHNPHEAIEDGHKSLTHNNKEAFKHWKGFIDRKVCD